MTTSPPDRAATVWSATFIPSKSPIDDFGEEGYSVAWVDTDDGRVQVLVDGARPEPGSSGRLMTKTFNGQAIEMFSAGAP